MKRTNKSIDGKQEFRFYKSNLPKIVWDPKHNKVMADFEGGSFMTSELRVAKILLEKGYHQIPVDAVEPPDVLVRIPGKSLGENEDIKVGALAGSNQDNGARVPVVQEGPSVL